MSSDPGLAAVIAVALGFGYTNGFHDSANAIATSVSTRALTPRAALAMAAAMNLIGAFVGTGVAQTITSGIITTPTGTRGVEVVFAALFGAIVWNLATWSFGLPSSSSHALIGGLVGAALAAGSGVIWRGVVDKVVIPMVLSPVVGFVLGGLVMIAILWIFRHRRPAPVNRCFRIAQTASAAAMALAHGLQDTQKTIGAIVLVLIASGHHRGDSIPVWVIIVAAASMSLGTYIGGWRIMRTLGRRVIEPDSPRGFAAEATAATVLYVTSYAFAAPVSTTHVITSAIMGVGATRRRSAVRWGTAGDIVAGWVLTLPAAALVAAAVYCVTRSVL
jgi:PiT family inorganic phosphate transporter